LVGLILVSGQVPVFGFEVGVGQTNQVVILQGSKVLTTVIVVIFNNLLLLDDLVFLSSFLLLLPAVLLSLLGVGWKCLHSFSAAAVGVLFWS